MTASSMHRHDVFVSMRGTKSFLSALQLYMKSSLCSWLICASVYNASHEQKSFTLHSSSAAWSLCNEHLDWNTGSLLLLLWLVLSWSLTATQSQDTYAQSEEVHQGNEHRCWWCLCVLQEQLLIQWVIVWWFPHLQCCNWWCHLHCYTSLWPWSKSIGTVGCIQRLSRTHCNSQQLETIAGQLAAKVS